MCTVWLYNKRYQVSGLCLQSATYILESDAFLFSICRLPSEFNIFSKGYFFTLLSSSSSSSCLYVSTQRLQAICFKLFSPFQDSSLHRSQPHWSGTVFFSLGPAGWILTICLCVCVCVHICGCMFMQSENGTTGMSAEAGSSFLYREVDDVVSSELAVEVWEAQGCTGWPPVSCA